MTQSGNAAAHNVPAGQVRPSEQVTMFGSTHAGVATAVQAANANDKTQQPPRPTP
jgi:hypothetical protein